MQIEAWVFLESDEIRTHAHLSAPAPGSQSPNPRTAQSPRAPHSHSHSHPRTLANSSPKPHSLPFRVDIAPIRYKQTGGGDG